MMNRRWRHCAPYLAAAVHLLVQPSLSQAQSQGDRDLKAISSYQLSMPLYKQYLNALENLAVAAGQDPAMAAALEASGELSLDQSVKRYDEAPAVRRAIADAGLTTREFVLAQGGFLQTGLAYVMMKEGNLSPDSVMKTAKVSRANLEFYGKNEAEIKRLAQEYEARLPAELRKDWSGGEDGGEGEPE